MSTWVAMRVGVLIAAVLLLPSCGGPSDGDRVLGVLKQLDTEPDNTKRQELRESICQLGDRAVPSLIQSFRTGDTTRRAAIAWVIECLPESAQQTAVADLEGVLIAPDEGAELRRWAAIAISDIPPWGPVALERAVKEADAVGRRMATAAMRSAEDLSAFDVSVITTALRDVDDETRRNAAWIVADSPELAAHAVHDLNRLLDDPYSDIGGAAFNAMCRAGPPAIPILLERVDTSAKTVNLARMFREQGDAGLDALIAELDAAEDTDRIGNLLGVLQHMGSDARRAVPSIRRHLESDHGWTRKLAKQAIRLIQESEGHGG